MSFAQKTYAATVSLLNKLKGIIVMAAKFRVVDRDTPMLLPCDMRDWLPEDHIVHYIIDTIEMMDLSSFKVNGRGTGSEQFSPSMMLALLVYSYITGTFSSRKIEAATYYDLATRYICGGDLHPDHDTICTFRKKNAQAFSDAFLKLLCIASEIKAIKKVGSVSVDGTKVKAAASKHKAVSYKRANELIEQLTLEIEGLVAKAEDADAVPLEDGLSVPEEIARREERKASLEKAKKVMEERFEEKHKQDMAEYEEKMARREKYKQETGKNPSGPVPKKPENNPDDKAQYNYTDPESRIMKSGNSKTFDQCFNAQAAVDADGSMMILGTYVNDKANDKQELADALDTIPEQVKEVTNALADNGYMNEQMIKDIEAKSDTTVLAAVGRDHHNKGIKSLEKHDDPPPPEADAPFKKVMKHRLSTKEGKDKYKLRKQTVEPVFGIIKEVIGFRQFHLRGLENVNTEWTLVTLAYSFKRLFSITNSGTLSSKEEKAVKNG